MDIYIVLDGARVVGASARLQGAESIRADEAKRRADTRLGGRSPALADPAAIQRAWQVHHRDAYDRMTITNTELQDVDD